MRLAPHSPACAYIVAQHYNAAFIQATITVRASDDPHGVVEFQAVSVSTDESSPARLTIVRQFGTIGEDSLHS